MSDDLLKAWHQEIESILRKEQQLPRTRNICPKCHKPALTYYAQTGRLLCQQCGFQVSIRM